MSYLRYSPIFYMNTFMCKKLVSPNSLLDIGIIGGGQLGRMLIYDAHRLSLSPDFVDAHTNAVASRSAPCFGVGNLNDTEFIYQYGRSKRFITLELENVSVQGLQRLEEAGVVVCPSSEVIATLQDKKKQKDFYARYGVPTLDYKSYIGTANLIREIQEGERQFPFVWKACRGGYDGKGVRVIQNLDQVKDLPQIPCICEPFLEHKREIAIVLVRRKGGQLVIYPPVEMEFFPDAHLVSTVQAPANISPKTHRKALDIGEEIAHRLGIVGTLAVELFLSKDDKLYVNESAPRVHNSGHWTMNGAETSQFEQHWRAVLDWPLGSTSLVRPTVMCNMIGHPKSEGGVPRYHGLEKILAISGAYFYDYGKTSVTPYRKMGHVNICRANVSEAYDLAHQILETVEVNDH